MNDPKTKASLSTNGKSFVVVLVALLAVGAVLRLYALGKSLLWIDEITIFWFGDAQRTASQIISEIWQEEFHGFSGQHMPFQYVLVNAFLRLYQQFGMSVQPALIRFPFALMGIASLPLFYLVAARAYGRRIGLWTLALTSISFFHVYHSRDATSYAPLIFFLALNLYALIGLVADGGAQGRRRMLLCLLFVVGSAGMLFTHLTGWLFLGAEGLLLGLWVIGIALGRRDRETTNYFAPAKFLFIPLCLLVVAALPFLRFIFAAMRDASGGSGAGPATTFSLPLLLYQFGYFGWGREGGRLTAFLVAWLIGVAVAWRRPAWRGRALFQAGLVVIPVVVFFMVIYRNYTPRYLSVTYLPFIGFAAIGLDAIVEGVAARYPPAARSRRLAIAAVALCLAAWSAGPMRVMLNAPDKREPISHVRDWILKNVPEGGLYVWRNGYYTRDIPRTVAVGQRYVAFGEYPNAGIPENVLRWRSENARSFFYRFPLAPVITLTEAHDALWSWIQSDFAHHELLADDSVARLWTWGLSPGVNYRKSRSFTVFYNREEDVLARSRAMGEVALWPVGLGWHYVQSQEGSLFIVSLGRSQLLATCAPDQEGRYRLLAQAVGQGAGQIQARLEQAGRAQDGPLVSFAEGRALDLDLGAFDIEPGQAMITLAQRPVQNAPLLIHAFRLAPAPEAAAPEETKP